MDRLRSTFASMSPRGRVVVAASALGLVLFTFFFFKMATKPSYTTLVSGVEPAETGKVTSALSEKGIGYELQNNGTAIAVEKAKVPEARIALAEGNLTGNAKPGYELFKDQKMGASEFQQQVTYKRALEGEIGNTIAEIDGISGATVQLTMPEDELFAEEEKATTAAVMLSGGESLDSSKVRGIANLTASSVEGLKTENVTITDSSGALLWPSDEAGAAGMGSGTKMGVESRYERSMEAKLNALLMQTVGPGKGRVQVDADLDANRATQEKLDYANRGTPLSEKTETETLEGAAGGGAAAGTAGNVPQYAAGGGGDGAASNYERESEDTQNAVDKTVTRTEIAPGTVEKQSVALVLDDKVPAEQVPELRAAVEAAAGIDEERGDILNVSQVPFAAFTPPGAKPMGGILDILKWVGLGLATLVFLFLLMRQLKKRENEELAREPVWLREIEAPATLAQLEADTRQMPVVYEPAAPTQERQIVEQAEPERVAQQIRTWMKQ
jgi:flagellar M-ring protein FliF